MMNWEDTSDGVNVSQVQLTDLEDAVHLSPGYDICDKKVGNYMWRSPEAHTEGPVNKPSDMFSFGVVVSRRALYVSLTFRVDP